jgi:hypothetical protein
MIHGPNKIYKIENASKKPLNVEEMIYPKMFY